jgi:diacylglycerol O-acyltransferase / wax synthase
MSYNGGIDFGLLGDYDAMPDIETVAGGIREALAELVELARAAAPTVAFGDGAVGARPATARS